MRQLQDARKQRSFEEQERDFIFRKLEIVRAEMIKEEAEKFTTLKSVEQSRTIEQAELKVTFDLRQDYFNKANKFVVSQ